MKSFFFYFFILSLLFAGCNTTKGNMAERPYIPVSRIACIGDGTTLGYGLENKLWDSYPAQLQRLLGSKWQVKNFGVPGATVLQKGKIPYRNQETYTKALAYNPNVVIIALGASDIDSTTWEYKEYFTSNLKEIITEFKALESRPGIFLCYPPPSYENDWEDGAPNQRLANEIIPRINKVASELRIGVIDLFNPLQNKPELFPDSRHPNTQGSRLIAAEVYNTIVRTYSMPAAGHNKPRTNIPKPNLFPRSISIGNIH